MRRLVFVFIYTYTAFLAVHVVGLQAAVGLRGPHAKMTPS